MLVSRGETASDMRRKASPVFTTGSAPSAEIPFSLTRPTTNHQNQTFNSV